MRVLLVDDERDFVSTLSERLSLRGIDAEWAVHSDDAILKLKDHRYDIAVLDIKMPGLGGIELKKILAEKAPDMKFIFLTGHGSEEDFNQIVSQGSDKYYLVKPIQIDELIEKMKDLYAQKGKLT